MTNYVLQLSYFYLPTHSSSKELGRVHHCNVNFGQDVGSTSSFSPYESFLNVSSTLLDARLTGLPRYIPKRHNFVAYKNLLRVILAIHLSIICWRKRFTIALYSSGVTTSIKRLCIFDVFNDKVYFYITSVCDVPTMYNAVWVMYNYKE